MNRIALAVLFGLAAAQAQATAPAPTPPPPDTTITPVAEPAEIDTARPAPAPEPPRGSTPVYGRPRPISMPTPPPTAPPPAATPPPAAAAAPAATPVAAPPAAAAAPAGPPVAAPPAAAAAPAPTTPAAARPRSPVEAALASPVPIWIRNGLLVEQGGRALYFFDRDTPGQPSRCDAACNRLWPPYYAEAGAQPHGGFTITQSEDGKPMWAFNGRPLYRWISDKKRGDAGGDGINGTWRLATVTAVEARDITPYFPMPAPRNPRPGTNR